MTTGGRSIFERIDAGDLTVLLPAHKYYEREWEKLTGHGLDQASIEWEALSKWFLDQPFAVDMGNRKPTEKQIADYFQHLYGLYFQSIKIMQVRGEIPADIKDFNKRGYHKAASALGDPFPVGARVRIYDYMVIKYLCMLLDFLSGNRELLGVWRHAPPVSDLEKHEQPKTFDTHQVYGAPAAIYEKFLATADHDRHRGSYPSYSIYSKAIAAYRRESR